MSLAAGGGGQAVCVGGPSLLAIFRPLSLTKYRSRRHRSLLLLYALLYFAVTNQTRAGSNDSDDSERVHCRVHLKIGVNNAVPVKVPRAVQKLGSCGPHFGPKLTKCVSVPLPRGFNVRANIEVRHGTVGDSTEIGACRVTVIERNGRVTNIFANGIRARIGV